MRNLIPLIAVILILSAFASCKKSNVTPAVNTSNTVIIQNGNAVSVTAGQGLSITLANPMDGGYTFNTPRYNTTILNLASHNHTNGDPDRTGDGGTDTFNFVALKSGSSNIIISASRAGIDTALFNASVVVQ